MVTAPRPIPGFEDAVHALDRAITEVSETLFFTFVERCDLPRFRQLTEAVREAASHAALPGGWLHARVRFAGPFSGHVDLYLPELLGAQLLSSFTGMPAEDAVADAQLLDMAGEFGNMVTGHWLRAVPTSQPFDLDPPMVSRLSSAWFPSEDEAGGDVHVALSEMPLRVRVQVRDLEVDVAASG